MGTASVVTAAPAAEWWERWADRRAEWWAARPVLTRRLSRVRAVALWAGLLWIGLLVIVMPEVRLSVRAYLGALWLVVAWYVLGRTKTLTWSGYLRFFTACLPWSVLIGVITTALSGVGGLGVSSAGPGTAIAAFTEEALKLVPVVLVVLAAPGRARRFSTIDWLLLGLASGAAFLAVEEVLRRLHWETASGFGRLFARVEADGIPRGWARFGLNPFDLGRSLDGVATGSHAALSALVCVGAGLGFAAWQHGSRRGVASHRNAWRVGAVLLPALLLWIAVVDHLAWNANAGYRDVTVAGGTPAWLDWRASTVPWVIRATWSFTGHGHGRTALLLVLALTALLVDARRLGARPEASLVPASPPPWVERVAVALPQAGSAVARAAALLVWMVIRDLRLAAAAHVRLADEPRREAVARGRLVVAGQRRAREEANALAARASARVVRLTGFGGLATLLVVGLLVGPLLALRIGEVPYDPDLAWLAAQLEGLGRWWNGLSTGEQMLVGVGIAAVVALSGGSLGLAFGLSGVATYGMSKAEGAATFVRDPRAATRDYLTTTTPVGALLDLGEFALTFGPGNFAGAATGRAGRDALSRAREALRRAPGGRHADEVLHSGGRYRPRPKDDLQAELWADDVYAGLRADTGLADDLARHQPDLDPESVRRALQHVLHDEQTLGGGVHGPLYRGQFAADADMAEAFLRLRKGEGTAVDRLLLEHEIAESSYLQQNPGATYLEAHKYANGVADWYQALRAEGRP